MKAYERLIKYAAFPTASHEGMGKTPSTDVQFDLAEYLVEEMKALGMKDVRLDDNCYVTGTIPATDDRAVTLGLLAHMDVSDAAPCVDVNCRLHENYGGGVVELDPNGEDRLDPAAHPVLKNYVGKTLLTTDGSTLLGADDKAGVAEIMTAAEYLLNHPEIKHGKIRVGFTPDEEIGEGADHFDVEGFGADFAFTVDGAAAGEVEYETFNAADGRVKLTGFSIHPGEAKGKMINACCLAAEFDALLPERERPQFTEGYEGFFHLTEMRGDCETAELHYIIRDHDRAKFEARKARFAAAADALNAKYGAPRCEVKITDSYYNMAEVVTRHPQIIEAANAAVRACGREPATNPVRGGTDGSRLSFMGLPCPNLGTGSHNHHGRLEFAVVEEMDKVVEILCDLVTRF